VPHVTAPRARRRYRPPRSDDAREEIVMNAIRRHRHPRTGLGVVIVLASAAIAAAGLAQPAAADSPPQLTNGPDGSLAPALDDAKGGNPGGNGGGKGKGKGGKPDQPGKPGGPNGGFRLELQPDVWNTNYPHSAGTVSAMIRGADLGDVNLDTIVLVGTDPAEGPVAALRANRHGNHIRAFFAKDDAFASLLTPKRGEIHEVAVEFTVGEGEDEEEVSLTDRVRIVGPDGEDDGEDDEEELDLDLAIQPDAWNVNWQRSNGTVSALIRGEGLADVDLDSIELVGTDPDAEPLAAERATLTGNHIRAFFRKADAFATLDTPKRGERHEITIRLSAGGEDYELTDHIRVVGPSH
jgi:hypothetical protein